MKNEIEELMMLTPKRKSILWRYKSDEDESIFVYGISKGRAIALSGEFAVNKEEVLKNSVIWKAGIITSTVDIITVYFVLWKKDIK